MEEESFYIHPARSEDDLKAVTDMFKAYVTWLGIDLTFQDFGAEINGMPGKYAWPQGELLLARKKHTLQVLGAVGLRPLELPGICEMKRLYVPEAGRGLGVGSVLIERVVGVARDQGYTEMRLDTLSSMKAAQRLYKRAGFVEIPKYYDNPVEGAMFMALDLREERSH